MLKKWKVSVVIGIVLLFLTAMGSANASQKYTDQTGKSCSTCHDMATFALSAFGKQFKANGYKIEAPKPVTKPAPKPAAKTIGKPKPVLKTPPKPIAKQAPTPAPKTAKPAPVKQAIIKSTYVGSPKCGQCHKDLYKGWQSTYHSKMIMKRDQGILLDAVVNWVYDAAGNQGPTIGNATKDTYYILDVQYVVGAKWKQRYLVRNPLTGGLQLMNKQFNVVTKRWENYGNANDWDTMCITCHSTGYQLTSYNGKDPASTKWKVSELNVGCESCHGPGSQHAISGAKNQIYNPGKQSYEVQARTCGYCHSRMENEKYLSRQGKYREDLPAPVLNQSWKPWDDWTKWYPDKVVIPGVQPEDKFNTDYTGDLKGLFWNDEQSVARAVYDEKKHHQEYQGFIQSGHYKKTSCTTCHNPHKRTMETKSLRAKPQNVCAKCHRGKADDWWKKVMPALGKTADNLFVRSHTFDAQQARPDAGLTADGIEPVYYFSNKK